MLCFVLYIIRLKVDAFNIHLVFDGGKSGDGGTVITTKALIRVGQFM